MQNWNILNKKKIIQQKQNFLSLLKLRSLHDGFQIGPEVIVSRVVLAVLVKRVALRREIIFESTLRISLQTARTALEIVADSAKHVEISKIIRARCCIGLGVVVVVVRNVQLREYIVHTGELIFKRATLRRCPENSIVCGIAVLGGSAERPEHKFLLTGAGKFVHVGIFAKIIVESIERIGGRWFLGGAAASKTTAGGAGERAKSKVIILSVPKEIVQLVSAGLLGTGRGSFERGSAAAADVVVVQCI